MVGATYIHVYQTLAEGNYAPYNFLTIFSDGFIAVWLLVLLYLYYRLGFGSKSKSVRKRSRPDVSWHRSPLLVAPWCTSYRGRSTRSCNVFIRACTLEMQ
jgi:hypothetical protein